MTPSVSDQIISVWFFFISLIILAITGIFFIIEGIPDIVSANVFPERLMINYIMNLIERT